MKKILFICTSLEPGRDGVGDYTRLLADACAAAGHTVQLLAVNDAHLSIPAEEIQKAPGSNIPLSALRLPANSDWAIREAQAAACARNFAADWHSWQIVPYGLHPKGIIPREARELATAVSEYAPHRHVMLHELWIGLSGSDPFRQRMLGGFQRRALLRFLRAISPAAADTTNPAYLTTLVRRDFASTLLPLFGNIPVIPLVERKSQILNPKFQNDPATNGNHSAANYESPLNGTSSLSPTDSSTPESFQPSAFSLQAFPLVGVLFGTIHPQFVPVAHAAFERLAAGARASGRPLHLVIIGRTGAHTEAFLAALAPLIPGKLALTQLGEISPDEVSATLHSADFGIATHPWALLGKSGAVAAMLDHGLPVFVPRNEWTLRGRRFAIPAETWPYSSGLVALLDDIPPEHMAGWLARRRTPESRITATAGQFLEHLASAES